MRNKSISKIEKLNLSDNEISNIDILKTVNFKEIKWLDLSPYNITGIKVLEKIKLKIREMSWTRKFFTVNM